MYNFLNGIPLNQYWASLNEEERIFFKTQVLFPFFEKILQIGLLPSVFIVENSCLIYRKKYFQEIEDILKSKEIIK